MSRDWIHHNGVWLPLGGEPGTVTGGPAPGLTWVNPPTLSKAGLGTQTTVYSVANSLAAGSRVYAGLASAGDLTTWANIHEEHVQRFGNGNNSMWRGGSISGQMAEWNGSTGAYWEDTGLIDGNHYHGDTGFGITRALNCTIELLKVENCGDNIAFGKQGISAALERLMGGSDGSVVRYCALLRAGDDVVENDWKDSITCYRNFMSGAMLISTRPGNGSEPERTDTRNKIMRLDGNLMWRRGKRYRDLTSINGVLGQKLAFNFFKWQTDGGTATPGPEYAMQCHMHNCILRTDGDPTQTGATTSHWGTLLTSGPNNRLTAQSNNWLLQPFADSGYPPGWPVNDLPSFQGRYLYGAGAAAKWNAEANAWAASHPELLMTTGDKGII